MSLPRIHLRSVQRLFVHPFVPDLSVSCTSSTISSPFRAFLPCTDARTKLDQAWRTWPVYRAAIAFLHERPAESNSNFTVAIEDLDAFDAELLDKIQNSPADYLLLFETAASEVLASLRSKVTDEAVRYRSPSLECANLLVLRRTVSMRSIGAYYMSKLVKIARITIVLNGKMANFGKKLMADQEEEWKGRQVFLARHRRVCGCADGGLVKNIKMGCIPWWNWKICTTVEGLSHYDFVSRRRIQHRKITPSGLSYPSSATYLFHFVDHFEYKIMLS
uniref:MCM N-terminal domain-containing protein n=1 Tax=Oryza punctata TaxID=4537 RepID=A0A0E0LY73_ORYPU